MFLALRMTHTFLICFAYLRHKHHPPQKQKAVAKWSGGTSFVEIITMLENHQTIYSTRLSWINLCTFKLILNSQFAKFVYLDLLKSPRTNKPNHPKS